MLHGGGVDFELTHESKGNKICTTTSPKAERLVEPVLPSAHAWDRRGPARAGGGGQSHGGRARPGPGSVPEALGLRFGAWATPPTPHLVQGPRERANLHRSQDLTLGVGGRGAATGPGEGLPPLESGGRGRGDNPFTRKPEAAGPNTRPLALESLLGVLRHRCSAHALCSGAPRLGH